MNALRLFLLAALAALLPSLAFGQVALSALPAASSAATPDIAVVVQGGVTKKVDLGNMTVGIASAAPASGLTGAGTGCTTFLVTPSSANLAACLTDETGTGAAVFGTAPTIDSLIVTTKVNLPRVTAFPLTPSAGDTVIVTDDSAVGACDSAAGSAQSLCQYNGVGWVSLGDGGSGSSGLTIGTTTITTGTNGYALYDNSGVVGEFALNSSTKTALANAPDAAGGLASACPTAGQANIGGSCQSVKAAIYDGQLALGTTAIASGACATVVTAAATGLATTSTVTLTYAATPVGVTGYDPSVTTGSLQVTAYPTANQVNISVCNPTASSITPAAMSVNVLAY